MRNLLTFLILASGIFQLHAQHPCLIANYHLDGDVNDTTANSHNGKSFGAISTTDRFGYSSSAMDFSGSDWIELNNSKAIIKSPEFTVMGWGYTRPNPGGSDKHHIMFTQRNDNMSSSEGVIIHCFGRQFGGAQHQFTLRGDTGITVTRISKAPAENYHEWHHYTFITGEVNTSTIGSGSTGIVPIYTRIFVDCELVAEDTTFQRPNFGNGIDHVYLGLTEYAGGKNSFWDGKIDELKIYNCPLTKFEICNAMNDTLHHEGMPSSRKLVSPLDFNLQPNPTQGAIYLKNTQILESFELYNLQGSLIHSGDIAEEIKLPLSLSNGIYELRLNGTKQVWHHRIILNR